MRATKFCALLLFVIANKYHPLVGQRSGIFPLKHESEAKERDTHTYTHTLTWLIEKTAVRPLASYGMSTFTQFKASPFTAKTTYNKDIEASLQQSRQYAADPLGWLFLPTFIISTVFNFRVNCQVLSSCFANCRKTAGIT